MHLNKNTLLTQTGASSSDRGAASIFLQKTWDSRKFHRITDSDVLVVMMATMRGCISESSLSSSPSPGVSLGTLLSDRASFWRVTAACSQEGYRLSGVSYPLTGDLNLHLTQSSTRPDLLETFSRASLSNPQRRELNFTPIVHLT